MKFRVERDVLAEAVAWAARSLPARPPVPVLAGLMLDAEQRAARAVQLRLRGLGPGRGRRRRGRARRRPGQRPAARRHLPQPAVPPGRGDHRRVEGRRHLRLAPGSRCSPCRSRTTRRCPRCPAPPGRCAATRSRRRSAQVSIAAGRDDTLPVLTGVRLEIEGEKITMAATDRYRLAVRDLAWTPGADRPVGHRAGAGPHPGRHREVAGLGRQGHRRAGPPAAPATAWSASRAPAGARRPGCSTASSRSTSRCCPRSPRASPPSTPPPGRVGTPGGAGRRAQHPDPAELHRRRGHPRGRQRGRGAGLGVPRRRAHGRRHLDRVQPGVPARRSERPGRAATPSCGSPPRPGRPSSRARTAPTRPRATTTATCSCRSGSPAEHQRPVAGQARRRPRSPELRRQPAWRSDSSASDAWAATCASGCAGPATPSSATTATRRSATPPASRTWSSGCPRPRWSG